MKINLIKDDSDTLSGYTNVNIAKTGLGLDGICENGEAQEIRALQIVNLVPGQQVEALLNHLLGKLAHKGTLTVSVPAIDVIAFSYLREDLSLPQFNQIVHSGQVSFDSVSLVVFFESKGLKVLSKKIHNFYLYLTVERP